MKQKLAVVLGSFAALVACVGFLAGSGSAATTQPSESSERRALGKVVASDTAKQHPEAAVARAKLSEFGKVSWQVTSKPSGLVVENAFIVRCQKGFLFDYYPGPGDLKTIKDKTPISGSYKIPLADPDFCDFQVAGLIPGESEKRGKVITRIFDKG